MNRRETSFRIRRATLKDLEILIDQRRRMFEDIHHRRPAELKIAVDKYKRWVVDMTKRRRFAGFLAINGKGEAMGGGCVWLKDSQPSPGSRDRVPYLLSMYTKPQYRGIGIATTIVKEAMAWSKKKGCKTMTLHASEYGRPIYTKLGFERTWEMRIDLSKFSPRNNSLRRRYHK